MYNMSGLAGEPSIEDIGGVWRARSDADDSYDELAVAGTGQGCGIDGHGREIF
jgi:hypothetical protein